MPVRDSRAQVPSAPASDAGVVPLLRQVHAGLAVAVGAAIACAPGSPGVRHLNPETLPRPNGYSHVVEVTGGRTLFVSGQLPLNQAGELVGAGDLRAQTRQVFENLEAALRASGATLDHVVKITVFMTDVSGLAVFREVRDSYFSRSAPASSVVQVDRLLRAEAMIEIEAVAVADER
jgi:reactive intermediate/imine deaminase